MSTPETILYIFACIAAGLYYFFDKTDRATYWLVLAVLVRVAA